MERLMKVETSSNDKMIYYYSLLEEFLCNREYHLAEANEKFGSNLSIAYPEDVIRNHAIRHEIQIDDMSAGDRSPKDDLMIILEEISYHYPNAKIRAIQPIRAINPTSFEPKIGFKVSYVPGEFKKHEVDTNTIKS